MEPSSVPTDADDYSRASASAPATPIVELRQYQINPSQTSLYTQRVQTSPLHDNLPLAFFGMVETGSIFPLHTAVHLYHYPGGHSDRWARRAALSENDEWNEYLSVVRPCMMQQLSGTFVEADVVIKFDEVKGLKHWVDSTSNDGCGNATADKKSVIELRRYQLKLGYHPQMKCETLSAFLQMYAHALPSRLKAEYMHPTTQLVTVLVSSVGGENTVYEVWKHGGRSVNNDGEEECYCGWQAMEQSSNASLGTKEWRMVLSELVTSIDTAVLKPLEFSPL